MLIDTHCHLTYDDLSRDLAGVLDRAARAGVARLITVATSPADAQRGIELIGTRAAVFMAAGVHPHEAGKVSQADLQSLADLHQGRRDLGGLRGRLVAVGETGLDFHYDFAPRDRQEQVFRFQLELARAVNRPVIIHAREAELRVCDILDEYPQLSGRVVFHCFSKGPDVARRILDSGWWLSFTGVTTFRNAGDAQASARFAPPDRIMVETDAPYLSPEPVRKVRPCEPAFVAHTARFLASLRGEGFEQFAERTRLNAEKFFGLPGDSG